MAKKSPTRQPHNDEAHEKNINTPSAAKLTRFRVLVDGHLSGVSLINHPGLNV